MYVPAVLGISASVLHLFHMNFTLAPLATAFYNDFSSTLREACGDKDMNDH